MKSSRTWPATRLLLVGALLLGPLLRDAWTQAAAVETRIQPKDILDVRVLEVPELSVRQPVSAAGTIELPLVGSFVVADLTAAELAAKLEVQLEAKGLQRATVTVEVERARTIAVLGAVKQPGTISFPGRWTLLEALAAAGGLTESHGGIVYVQRRASNGLADQLEIRVKQLVDRADPSLNIPVFADDLIQVPAVQEVNVLCLGAVARPGTVTFRDGAQATLLLAIAQAGGLTGRASSKLTLRRFDELGRATDTQINYNRVFDGKQPDPPLQDGDVILVKESFF